MVYYAFPTLDQLGVATEEALREDGFGYRAKFVVGSVAALRSKPGGGAAWLLGLRDAPYDQAVQELSELPGVGPKVAACVCLFSLDKAEAIPVDTHVWALATRYYAPHLKGKSLTRKMHQEVQEAFVGRFGPYAGWAHNTLFISELSSMKGRLPPATTKSKSKGKGDKGGSSIAATPHQAAPASGSAAAAGLAGRGLGGGKRGRRGQQKEEGEGTAITGTGLEGKQGSDKAAGAGEKGLAGWRKRKVGRQV